MDIFWIILAVIAVVVLCFAFYYMGKYKWVGKLCLCLAGAVFFGFSMFCVSDLNYYYNAKGGIFGVINGLFDVNTIEGEGLEFSLKNIELKQVEGDQYSADIKIDRMIDFEQDVDYIVCINGVPCTSSEVKQNYAQATYEYKFYNQDLSVKIQDTLTFSFAFYPNYTTLTVTTNGGTDAVKQWNSYFNKNNFDVTIEENYLDYISKTTEGNISNFRKITYYVDDQVYETTYFDSTKPIDWITSVPSRENYTFAGWSIDGENIVNNFKSTKDVKVYAVFTNGEILFSGEKEIFSTLGEIHSSYTFDLNEHFTNISGRNISVTLKAVVYAPYGEQAWINDLTLNQSETGTLVCDYEEAFKATIELENQSIKITPNNYSSGYSYSITVYQIISYA